MKKLWFKAKRYGLGWTPCSWEGWLVLLAALILMVADFRWVDGNSHSVSDTLIGAVPVEILIIFVLILICYRTGEKPRWRWPGSA